MGRLTKQAREFIDAQLKGKDRPNYTQIRLAVRQKFGLAISKTAISKRAKAQGLRFLAGRQPRGIGAKKPQRSVPLDYAGAVFLRGAESQIGLLSTINQLLNTSSDSVQAKRAFSLAQKINAILLYAPLLGLKSVSQFTAYRRELGYLCGLKQLPSQKEIQQYLRFLEESKLLSIIIKEVMKNSAPALFLRIDFAAEEFYLDGQMHTIWPSAKIPESFSTTLSRARSYVRDAFLEPSAQQPLILQICPGYNVIPNEMWGLMHCFERAASNSITSIAIKDGTGQLLAAWRNLRPPSKCYFLAPLSPWQYAKLHGTQIVRNFRQFQIGPEREPMEVAEAYITLSRAQPLANIKVRVALIKRKTERLALITNIFPEQERYIRRIAELYFWRWPEQKTPSFYDLLEQAHQQLIEHNQQKGAEIGQIQPSLGLAKEPLAGFSLLLEYLHRYARDAFFPAQFAQESLPSMTAKFYRHPGFLKNTRRLSQAILQPFSDQNLGQAGQRAGHKFNQAGIEYPDSRRAWIKILEKK